jgi:DNA-binding GntR family transcriptional regulator
MIRRHPLAEQAAEELLRRIGSGEWTVGAKLPGETTLATQLGFRLLYTSDAADD